MPAATPAMLPVPIVAASAVMNAWNGVRTPPALPAPRADERASASREPPDLHHADSRSVRNSPLPKQQDDQPRHEQRIGERLDARGDRVDGSRQMLLLDWQPSTTTDAPLTQLARGEARNATTSPTSSARPKRPNGSSRRRTRRCPPGSACCRFCHEPPGNRIDPGATLTHADVVAARAAAPATWPGRSRPPSRRCRSCGRRSRARRST